MMLAAVVLTMLVSIGLILTGFGMVAMVFTAEAMTPIPGQTKAGGFAIAGMALAAAGAGLLVLAIWGGF